MGLDDSGSSWGWWLDDVRVYNCTVTLTGNAGVAGATLNYVDGTNKTTIADGSGNYTITVPYGWSGTVTPYKSGYTFTPVSKTYSNVQSNQTAQNYSAKKIILTTIKHCFVWRLVRKVSTNMTQLKIIRFRSLLTPT